MPALLLATAHASADSPGDTIAGVTFGDPLPADGWVRDVAGQWSRPVTVATVQGLLYASPCGTVVGALSFRAGWTNAADAVVARTLSKTRAAAVSTASGSRAELGATAFGGAVSGSLEAGTASASGAAMGATRTESAKVIVALASDTLAADPQVEATEAFFVLSDAMKAKGWAGRVIDDGSDPSHQMRRFEKDQLIRILDLSCTADGAQVRCEVRLTTREAGCTDGI